ncbi:MAG: protein kinase [Deltaproteobacteria bacterium]|nr:protein kinase [Deltaproteobacteria bacterium]MDQ3298552.1 protein kinase [Myxococcota bacterium]
MSAPFERSEAFPDKLIGEVLAGRYQIEARIGEGAMGAVYKAKHVKVGRTFAVKVLHRKLLEDHKVAQRFEREAELAGRLRHPNVVGVVDVGETPDGLRYMVMDFALGEDLATLLNEAPMPPERILHLTKQMLEGLFHAHEAGLIHRDFKPENVIVERDDHGTEVPRIVDFGIAILREGGDSSSATGRLTTNGLVLGTPHYMAPEQAVADPIDHRIDLFALGIVVYEMLCGKLPFDGSGAEVARANLLLDPPRISERVPYLEVDPLLEAFARRLMDKKRELRPATAKIARDLLDLIERDRAAAATALGVPLPVGLRSPQITEPVTPQRAVNEDSGNFMQPKSPAALAGAPELRPTDLEAPPVSGPIASRVSAERSITTARNEALGWEGKRSRGWVFVLVGMLAIAGVVIAIVASRKTDDARPPATSEEQKVAVETAAPVQPPAPVEPATATEVGSAAPVADPVTEPVVDPFVPTEAAPPPKPKRPDRTRKPATGTGGTSPDRTETTPAEPVVKPVEVTKPADPVKPADPQPAVANAIFVRYQSVGRDLKALGDKATDLWPRYRLININQVMMAPEKRGDANTILSELEKTIASRK